MPLPLRPMALARLALSALLLLCSTLRAQEGEEGETPQAVERMLGEIHFPTTAQNEEAQQAFIRGMLLLHLFEYPFARAEFQVAQELEPEFVMAYWGEAMTHNHPLWDEQDRAAGRAALAKLGATAEQRLAGAGDDRERAFLASLEILYGDGTKAARDRAYLRALEQMALAWPDDHEVQLFYALSLLGVGAGVRDTPTYMLSTAISQAVFCANPRHPGAAHYLIHGVDDPEHAALGLAAARALAEMAPDAGHSLHMTSHIFTALGMWSDVVAANENALRVQNAMRKEQGEAERNWGHYAFWLLYGYLQQGRHADARALLETAYRELQEANQSPGDPLELEPDRSQTGSVVQMWVRYLIETRDWDGDIAGWTFKLGDAFDPNLNFSYVQALRAAQAAQASGVQQYLGQFTQLQQELGRAIRNLAEPQPQQLQYLERLRVMEQQLLAVVEIARGETLAAARFAGEASRLEGAMPYSYGPPFVDWPAAEMHGELLLAARRPADAAEAFEQQLKRTRLRSASLLGLAQARSGLGQDAEAAHALTMLGLVWLTADQVVRDRVPGLPTLPPAGRSDAD